MRHEPGIGHGAILGVLRARYGVAAAGLAFVPVGYAAACYRVDREDGAGWFLKVWPAGPGGEAHSAWRPDALRLARAIDERVPGLRVPGPLRTRDGALWAAVGDAPLALFPLLPGASPRAWTPPLREGLARAMATLHRATPLLADVLPRREAFELPFADDLRRDLAGLEAIGPGERAGLLALRDWLLPRRDEVLAQLDRLEGLRGVVVALPGPLVVCHTDIGDENLLTDGAGALAVLDWDEATLAPPEYDLYSAREMGGIGAFVAAYRAAGGPGPGAEPGAGPGAEPQAGPGAEPQAGPGAEPQAGPLHIEHLIFAQLRRHVGDMAVRLREIMAGEGPPGRDEAALREIGWWGFDGWRGMDAAMAEFAAALGAG